jgi:hypothetical protein
MVAIRTERTSQIVWRRERSRKGAILDEKSRISSEEILHEVPKLELKTGKKRYYKL